MPLRLQHSEEVQKIEWSVEGDAVELRTFSEEEEFPFSDGVIYTGRSEGLFRVFGGEDKTVRRAEALAENHFGKDTMIINFCGADGFYDDKLFTTTAVFNYIMKGFDGFITANGNSFREPLQVFDAEYQWNCDHSGFFNLKDRPGDQETFMELYRSALDSGFRPEEIYSEFGRAFLPMRWDNEEITAEMIGRYSERFSQCSMVCRAFMADFLEYNAELMLSGIRTGKRIPDNRRPLTKKTWW